MNKTNVKKRYRMIFWFLILCLCLAVITIKKLKGNKEDSIDNIGNVVANVIEGEEGKVTTNVETSLKKVFEISELSTADYTYNAIAKAYGEDGTTIRYYVAYEGKVKAGIDFSKISIAVDEEEKIFTILLPDIEFQEKNVNPGTLEYIFKDKKSETETVHQEAYELCKKDLEERIDKEEEFLKFAKENTETVVKALVMPWAEQSNDKYRIKIQWR